MALDTTVPEELRDFEARLCSVAIAEQREGELLLSMQMDSDFPEDAKKLIDALSAHRIEIDGRPVRGKFLQLGGAAFAYIDWSAEGNESMTDPRLGAECREAVNDGRHNSNSFLTFWREEFWLIHANSPYHIATPECELILWRSKDAVNWTKVRTFSVPDEDIRDPKFAVIGDRLFIYYLMSLVDDTAEPYTTAVVYTDDGTNFSEPRELFDVHGWLLWNPRTHDGKTWYAPAYWCVHGNSVILKTVDGLDFEPVAYIHRGKKGFRNDMNDETDFAFFDDGRLLSVQRLEYRHHMNSDARCCSNLTVAKPPYTEWVELGRDYETRLDGLSMFSYNNRIYALGRRNPYLPGRHNIGSLLGRKRTALYEVTEKGLVFISDLPSSGDTSYGGCVLKDGFLYASYYSSDVGEDPPWIVGMFCPSSIMIAKIPLDNLEKLAAVKRADYDAGNLYKLVKDQ